MIDFQSSCINACVLDCGSPLPLSHRLPRPLPSRLLVMFCVRYVFKTPFLRNEPNFQRKLLSIKKIPAMKISPSRLFKPIQGYASPQGHIARCAGLPKAAMTFSPSSAVKQFSGKKRLFIFSESLGRIRIHAIGHS